MPLRTNCHRSSMYRPVPSDQHRSSAAASPSWCCFSLHAHCARCSGLHMLPVQARCAPPRRDVCSSQRGRLQDERRIPPLPRTGRANNDLHLWRPVRPPVALAAPRHRDAPPRARNGEAHGRPHAAAGPRAPHVHSRDHGRRASARPAATSASLLHLGSLFDLNKQSQRAGDRAAVWSLCAVACPHSHTRTYTETRGPR